MTRSILAFMVKRNVPTMSHVILVDYLSIHVSFCKASCLQCNTAL